MSYPSALLHVKATMNMKEVTKGVMLFEGYTA